MILARHMTSAGDVARTPGVSLARRGLLCGLSAGLVTSASTGRAAANPMLDYERASGGHIGVFAQNIATGAKLTWRADERVVMCSTVKASIVALTLRRVDRGEEHLEDVSHYTRADIGDVWAPAAEANLAKGTMSVATMCQAAVELSDGACANLLLRRLGGPAAVTAFWRALGDPLTRLDHGEPFLNRTPANGIQDTTTPAAMAGNLRAFILGDVLSPASRARLRQWLIGCKTGGDRLRAGLPGNWVIGDKTGHNGRDAAGDIAICWPNPATAIIICAYTRGGATSPAQFDTAFADIGRLVASKLV